MSPKTPLRTPSRKTHPQGLVETLKLRTAALSEILETETRALSASDVKAFFALQSRKEETARDFHTALVDVAALGREGGPAIDPALKSQVESLRLEISGTIQRNRAALERSGRSFQRLGERIVTHARRAAEERSRISYSAAGTIRPGSRNLSMGLSESA